MENGSPAARSDTTSAIKLEITYYTDPLCCWSWGFEPQVRRLRYAHAGHIAWRTRMGAMILDWQQFGDPLNSVHRPAQMGPLWMQAASVTGMPIGADIWVEDPPQSSIPACLAFKAAESQSARAGDLLLRRLREAVMLQGRNIGHDGVIREAARELGRSRPEIFDFPRFERELGTEETRKRLEDDVREARFRGIGRFPCLVLHRPPAPPSHLVGWHPYEALREALLTLAPDIGEERRPETEAGYARYWAGTTEREGQEVFGTSRPVSPEEAALFPSPSSGAGE